MRGWSVGVWVCVTACSTWYVSVFVHALFLYVESLETVLSCSTVKLACNEHRVRQPLS